MHELPARRLTAMYELPAHRLMAGGSWGGIVLARNDRRQTSSTARRSGAANSQPHAVVAPPADAVKKKRPMMAKASKDTIGTGCWAVHEAARGLRRPCCARQARARPQALCPVAGRASDCRCRLS